MKYFFEKFKDRMSKVKENIEYFAREYPKIIILADYITTQYSLGEPKIAVLEREYEDGTTVLVLNVEFELRYYTEQEEIEDIIGAFKQMGYNVEQFYVHYDDETKKATFGFYILPKT